MSRLPWAKLGLFAGGVLFGTAGIKILSSKDAKKCYTNATAAVLRAKDCVMETVTTVRENCDDILSDAKDINAERAAADEEAVINRADHADSGRGRSVSDSARRRFFVSLGSHCDSPPAERLCIITHLSYHTLSMTNRGIFEILQLWNNF